MPMRHVSPDKFSVSFLATFFKNLKSNINGFSLLTGYLNNNNELNVLGTLAPCDSLSLLLCKAGDIEIMLPGGVDIVGVFKMVDDLSDNIQPIIDAFCDEIAGQLSVYEPIIVLCDPNLCENDPESVACYKYNCDGQGLTQIHSIRFDMETRSSLSLRLESHLSVGVMGNSSEAYMNAFNELENRVSHCGFLLESSDTALIVNEEQALSQVFDGNSTCAMVYNHIHPPASKRKQRKTSYLEDYVIFQPVRQLGSVICPDAPKCVPVVYADNENQSVMHIIPLKIGALVFVESEMPLSTVAHLLRVALIRQLTLFRLTIMRYTSEGGDSQPKPPTAHRFLPGLAHFLHVAYPNSFPMQQLEMHRKQLHSDLGLPLERPLLRPSCAHKFEDETSYHLLNVHTYTSSPGDSGILSLTQGNYKYHHYMQDNFDDKGWGCAYRSFQTVWSWMYLQGYTDKPVPAHKIIQQALVDIGDRGVSFIGSRQWIGSIELGYCLDHMLGVSSRIITASSGEDLESKARELAHHFDTQGTPVMIGGGVLAHTILGVYFDEDTGDVKFLVLDPHYTGDENINTIVQKGWCGWKPVSFWQKDAFYNMLLPQRPLVL